MSFTPSSPSTSLASHNWENEGGSVRAEEATSRAPLLLPRRRILALRTSIGS
jgi:hypothetical protein